MKQSTLYMFSFSMFVLLFLASAPTAGYSAEVQSVETGGSIGFTGVNKTPGSPDPPPDGGTKPVYPIEIAKPSSTSSQTNKNSLPKTNALSDTGLLVIGHIVLAITMMIWFWKQKKQTEKEDYHT
ncbi:hypothetical protein [Enterococcus mundtii]|uniref:Cell wall protein n=1 Tax=Enterococcus mundtii TaxID=53346 RepID=A0A1V2UAY2_ENTMU|nr:hypothetical protein [Enterococcus mundtii]ONN40438.1 hypothetical protein BTN92_15025 [Enterococcus mundtii]